jgi:hypothetical protein
VLLDLRFVIWKSEGIEFLSLFFVGKKFFLRFTTSTAKLCFVIINSIIGTEKIQYNRSWCGGHDSCGDSGTRGQ